jgi:hypothetical protein
LTSIFSKSSSRAARCGTVPASTILDLVVFVNSIINDVDKSTIAALFKVAPALCRHPFPVLDLIIRLALLAHTGFPENHVPQAWQ